MEEGTFGTGWTRADVQRKGTVCVKATEFSSDWSVRHLPVWGSPSVTRATPTSTNLRLTTPHTAWAQHYTSEPGISWLPLSIHLHAMEFDGFIYF